MLDKSVVEFYLRKDDDPIEIQLEPDGIIFEVLAEKSLRFVAKNYEPDFIWAIRVEHKAGAIQLCPEGTGNYVIEVYESDILIYTM